LLLAALLGACATVPPRLAPSGHASKVILVSFDALTGDTVEQLSAEHAFSNDGFEKMLREGTFARVVPVTPTQTSVTHVSMITGAQPRVTGVLGNNFHVHGTPITQVASGFSTPIGAETIVEAARRQGKRVGVLAFPSFDGTNDRRRGDWGLVYTRPLTKGSVVHLARKDFAEAADGPCGTTFSPALRARLPWVLTLSGQGESKDINLWACDSTDDGVANYDQAKVRIGDDDLPLDARRWFAVSARLEENGESHLYGSWSKLLRFDSSLEQVSVYLGAISRNDGYPAELTQAIDSAAGFNPGPPDLDAAKVWLATGDGADAETFIEQVDRLAAFHSAATIAAMKIETFDLLLLYESIVDEAQHQFLLTLPDQLYSTPDHRAAAAHAVRDAFLAADRGVGTLLAAAPPGTAMLVTGDHGMAPAVYDVRLNQLLIDWGFAQASKGTLSPDSHWGAYGSGENVQLYHFAGLDDSPAVLAKLQALQGPDGTPVFERIERRTAADHPDAGDILAFTHTRYVINMALGDPFVKLATYGQHGGLNLHHELHTALFATGAGVAHAHLLPIAQTKIARYIAELLGMEAPRNAE
jgi:hypothetical protein